MTSRWRYKQKNIKIDFDLFFFVQVESRWKPISRLIEKDKIVFLLDSFWAKKINLSQMSEADSIFSDASNSDCGSIFSDASESDMETEIFQPKIVTTERTIGNLVAKRKNSFEFQKPLENIRDIRGETDCHSDEYRDRKVMMNLYYDSTEKPDPDQKKFDESASSISSSVSSLSPPGKQFS